MADIVEGGEPVHTGLYREDCPVCSPPQPCKHEWRQYLALHVELQTLEASPSERLQADVALQPNGFFCIHCTERRD